MERDFVPIKGDSMVGVWQKYVGYVLDGSGGFDEDVEIKERFWVTLHFESGADFNTAHPAMNLDQQAQYVRKLLNTEVDQALGGSYGYRLRCSYGLDQLALMADKLAHKPETKAACANLLHPLHSAMEQEAGMQRTACMTNIQALLREDMLHLSAHFRSQNVWNSHGNFKGLHELQGTIMQLLCERDIEVQRGAITVFVNAAHIYSHDFTSAAELLS